MEDKTLIKILQIIFFSNITTLILCILAIVLSLYFDNMLPFLIVIIWFIPVLIWGDNENDSFL